MKDTWYADDDMQVKALGHSYYFFFLILPEESMTSCKAVREKDKGKEMMKDVLIGFSCLTAHLVNTWTEGINSNPTCNQEFKTRNQRNQGMKEKN